MEKLPSVEIGGITVAFLSRIKQLDRVLNEKYSPFLTAKKADLSVTVDFRDNAPRVSGRLAFEVKDRYSVYENKSAYIFKLYPDHKPGSDFYLFFLDRSLRKAEFFVTRSSVSSRYNLFDFPLDQLLFMSILWQKEGLLLHSSAITVKDKAFIFLGCSGAGKSTISRILDKNGWPVLSDDRIIARLIKGRLVVHGTPWSGSGNFFRSRSADLGKVFFLYHGRQNRLTRINGHQPLVRFMTCAFIPYWDNRATRAGIDMAAYLAKKTECYDLEFLPDDSVFDFLKRAL